MRNFRLPCSSASRKACLSSCRLLTTSCSPTPRITVSPSCEIAMLMPLLDDEFLPLAHKLVQGRAGRNPAGCFSFSCSSSPPLHPFRLFRAMHVQFVWSEPTPPDIDAARNFYPIRTAHF